MAIPIRPYPGTYFEWEDRSDIVIPEIETVQSDPLYCAVFTSDKGPEDWRVVAGPEFFDLYAVNSVVNFDKHGQPLLQTAMTVNAGGRFLCKRIVADDAYLANVCICAVVSSEETQKSDSEGHTIYIDNITGEETLEPTDAEGADNEPAIVKNTKVRYVYKSVSECQSIEEVVQALKEEESADAEGETTYPLWVVTDNGRGTSRKRIRIIPNYTLSKNYENFFLYDFQVIESQTVFSSIHFALDPDQIDNGKNISFEYMVNTNSTQVKAYQFRDSLKAFLEVMIDSTNMSLDQAVGMDLLFGTNKRGKKIASSDTDVIPYGIEVDTEEGVDLSIVSGQILMNGDNGSFGDYPMEAVDANGVNLYATQMAKAFAGYVVDNSTTPASFTILTKKDGCYDPVIYDVDRFKIDLVCDANYPQLVKRAIEQLVTFREDFMFFRDLGTKANTIESIKTADEENMHTKFASTYCTYYDVIDPYSKKQITVTIMYHLSQMAVNHFNVNRSAPMAGLKYGFVLRDIIENTISFTPTICPGLNEKEDLYDMKINYATYIDNNLVIESLYTSQDKNTQLSFSNNVLTVQRMIKGIRSSCPASRYTFIDGEDLESYKQDIQRYLEPYRNDFAELTVEYMEDPYYAANKIFYAALGVRFRDFVQTEYFTITALGTEEI